MAKKYLSLEGLAEYDALIKAKIDEGLEGKADKSAIPTKVSQLTNDRGYITSDDLPPEALIMPTAEYAPMQILNAVAEGRNVLVTHEDETYGFFAFTGLSFSESAMAIYASDVSMYHDGSKYTYMLAELIGLFETGTWQFVATEMAQKSDVDMALESANSYTDTLIGELNDGFTDAILQMYGDDVTDDGAPTIREIATDEAIKVKNDLLNGAGEAYDTLKELGELIDDNQDAIKALEAVATGKADKDHNHDNVYETKTNAQAKLDDAKTYTDEQIGEIADTFDMLLMMMYDNGNDIPEGAEVLPSIRQIANDEATTVISELEPLIGTTTEVTPAQVAAAIEAGRSISITHTDATYGAATFNYFTKANNFGCIMSSGIVYYNGEYVVMELLGNLSGGWQILSTTVAQKDQVDESLSNKADKSAIPTKVSQLTNDSGFITADALPEGALMAYTSEVTPQQVGAAIIEGRDVLLIYVDSDNGTVIFNSFTILSEAVLGTVALTIGEESAIVTLIGDINENQWQFNMDSLVNGTQLEGLLTEFNEVIAGKADVNHNHDSKYDAKGSANTALNESNTYTDTAIENIGNEFGEIIIGMYGDDFDDTADSLVTIRQIAHDEVTTAVSSKADVNHNHDDKYDTKGSADAALASAKTYADNAATQVKNDLLNGAGDAYDTLKELGALIDDNKDAIDALEDIAAGKADKIHDHDDRYYTETEVNNKLSEKSDANHRHNYYGVCSTAAATAAKEVDIAGFELVEGAMVIVKFTNSNSASSDSNPTLNVSGTGAKPICRYGTTNVSSGTTSTGWIAGAVQVFVYDGTSWVRDYWSNTTYSNASLGQGYATCSTAANTVAKTASLSSYSLTTGGVVAVKFTNAVPAKATLNINSKGAKAVYYRGAAITGDVIKAGDVATFIYNGTYYHLISIDRWQEDIVDLKEYVDTQISEIPAITTAEIDAICGVSIYAASEVTF